MVTRGCRQECGVGGQVLARFQGAVGFGFDGDARAAGCSADGHAQDSRYGFDVADGEARAATPDGCEGCSAAVVGGVHSQGVLLEEVVLHWLHPVAAVLVGGAGEGVEATGFLDEFVGSVAPSGDLQRGTRPVGVGHLHQDHSGQALEGGQLDRLPHAIVGVAVDGHVDARAVPGCRVLRVRCPR